MNTEVLDKVFKRELLTTVTNLKVSLLLAVDRGESDTLVIVQAFEIGTNQLTLHVSA